MTQLKNISRWIPIYWIWLTLYVLMGLLVALGTHDSNFSFSVFQAYRFIFNNLHFPEVSGWNAMTHPANASEIHLYSTLFSQGYTWLMSTLASLFGLSPEKIRVYSVLVHMPVVYWAAMNLAKSMGPMRWWYGGIFLSAPLFIAHSVSCDWIVPSLGFTLLIFSELAKDEPKEGKLFLWAFLAVFFQFLNAVHISIFVAILCLWQIFNQTPADKKLMKMKTSLVIGAGIAAALIIAFISRSFASDQAIPFFEYAKVRGGQAISGHHSPSYLLYLMERVWSHFSFNFPACFLFCLCWGALVFGVPKSPQRDILLMGGFSHFLFCCFLSNTASAHYFYSFFYILMLPGLISHILSQSPPDDRERKFLLPIGIGLLCIMGSAGFYKLQLWKGENSPLDHFLGQLNSQDLLIRDNDFDTWPLNFRNPINTVYWNQSSDTMPQDPLIALNDDKVFGYELTWSTVFYARPKYQGWRSFAPGEGGKIFLITTNPRKSVDCHFILKEKRSILHSSQKTYYLYSLSSTHSQETK